MQYYDDTAVPTQPRAAGAGADKAGSIVEISSEVEAAVWWVNSATGGAPSARRRELEGEIHLDKDLQPTCDFALFKVSVSVLGLVRTPAANYVIHLPQYAVEFLPFATPVFQLQVKGSGSSSPTLKKFPEETLISHPVTIATLHGEGPIPVAYTQPTPRASKKIQARTYSPGSSAVAGVGVYI